jgi:hypothetical protein
MADAGAPTETVRGRANVLRRASGNWAVTYALRHARWTSPVEDGAVLKVQASFENLGGVVPARSRLRSHSTATRSRGSSNATPAASTAHRGDPAGARPLINNARVNETPILVAHTDENGNPVLTFRGSIRSGTTPRSAPGSARRAAAWSDRSPRTPPYRWPIVTGRARCC